MQLNGTVAVVTGAASGIGRALAQRLSARGCTVALVDIDEAGLRETAAGMARASVHLADVSNAAAVERLAADVAAQHGGVHLLINNAGVAAAGSVLEGSLEDSRWVMDVNLWGTVYGCRFFLPHLLRQPRAHIVNISSVFGLVAFPNRWAYCASKFAVRGFSDSLRAELAGTGVRVTCVHPGGVRTSIARSMRFADAVRKQQEADYLEAHGIAPEAAAARIVRGIERGATRILVGRDARVADVLSRAAPRWSNRMAARIAAGLKFI